MFGDDTALATSSRAEGQGNTRVDQSYVNILERQSAELRARLQKRIAEQAEQENANRALRARLTRGVGRVEQMKQAIREAEQCAANLRRRALADKATAANLSAVRAASGQAMLRLQGASSCVSVDATSEPPSGIAFPHRAAAHAWDLVRKSDALARFLSGRRSKVLEARACAFLAWWRFRTRTERLRHSWRRASERSRYLCAPFHAWRRAVDGVRRRRIRDWDPDASAAPPARPVVVVAPRVKERAAAVVIIPALLRVRATRAFRGWRRLFMRRRDLARRAATIVASRQRRLCKRVLASWYGAFAKLHTHNVAERVEVLRAQALRSGRAAAASMRAVLDLSELESTTADKLSALRAEGLRAAARSRAMARRTGCHVLVALVASSRRIAAAQAMGRLRSRAGTLAASYSRREAAINRLTVQHVTRAERMAVRVQAVAAQARRSAQASLVFGKWVLAARRAREARRADQTARAAHERRTRAVVLWAWRRAMHDWQRARAFQERSGRALLRRVLMRVWFPRAMARDRINQGLLRALGAVRRAYLRSAVCIWRASALRASESAELHQFEANSAALVRARADRVAVTLRENWAFVQRCGRHAARTISFVLRKHQARQTRRAWSLWTSAVACIAPARSEVQRQLRSARAAEQAALADVLRKKFAKTRALSSCTRALRRRFVRLGLAGLRSNVRDTARTNASIVTMERETNANKQHAALYMELTALRTALRKLRQDPHRGCSARLTEFRERANTAGGSLNASSADADGLRRTAAELKGAIRVAKEKALRLRKQVALERMQIQSSEKISQQLLSRLTDAP